MPQNKSAIIRYQALDRCFRNPSKKYAINDLIDECGDAVFGESRGKKETISRRSIYADIEFMKSEHGYNAPIESFKEGRNAYHRYSDLSFSINNQPLNEEETHHLKEAVQFLSRLSGREEFSIINNILPKLQGDIEVALPELKPIISYEENKYLKNKEGLGFLFNAIRDEQVLTIRYRSFKSKKDETYTIHPYYLKQYNNRWFLYGLCEELYENIHPFNLALDRMENIKNAKIVYIKNDEVDFETYFDDIIGVSLLQNKEVEKIVLRVSSEKKPYLETKPIHPSQTRFRADGDHFITSLKIIPNFEFYSTILALGEGISIESPDQVKNEMKQTLKEILKGY